jgi:predicted RNA-binding Zn ribbon-like protein
VSASARIAAAPRPPVNDTRLIQSGPTRSMRRPATGVTSTAPAPISAKTPTAWVDSPYAGPVGSSAIAVQAALNVPNISAWYTHDRRRSGSARSNIMGPMTFPGRRWVWYGGRPSLDFVNTRRNREAGRADEVAEYLRGPDDFTAWLNAAALGQASPGGAGPGGARMGEAGPGGVRTGKAGPSGVSPALDEETFAGALALREAISALVTATVVGDSAPPAAVLGLNTWLALSPERPVLHLESGVPVLGPAPAARTPRGVLAMIAADAAELLGTDLRERLRICPGPGCRGRFLDDSPAGRRRWCSMAVCGNRNKAAAHRQAVHAAAR